MISFFILMALVQAPKDWSEVKVGQCLTVDQLQELSGVMDSGVYSTGKCGADYVLEGESYQTHACGLEIQNGSWTRELVNHKEAGVFFPSPVPCKVSVSYFRGDFSVYDEGLSNQCDDLEPRVLYLQTEEMFTRKFSAGQGYLYLPSPMLITRQWTLEELALSACTQTQLELAYEGWGALSGEIREMDCYTGKSQVCKKAKMKNDTNANGATCLKITKIENCE